MSADLTVVVPTRNRGRLIEDTIRSLLALDHPGLEVVIVDQSTDEVTKQTVTQVAGNDPRIRLRSTNTIGVSIARNAGLSASRGDIVVYTDDDCIVTPRWLEAVEAEFRDPTVAAVYGRILPYETREASNGIGRTGTEAAYKPDLERMEYSKRAPPWYVGHGPNMAFRRSVLMETGAFDPLLGAGGVLYAAGDIDLIYRVLASGKRSVYAPAALVYHKQWKDWASRTKMERAYGIGVGAMTAKYVRCGDLYGLNLLATWIWQLGVRRLGAGLLKWRSLKVAQLGLLELVYPWIGVAKSLRHPVDGKLMRYVPSPLGGAEARPPEHPQRQTDLVRSVAYAKHSKSPKARANGEPASELRVCFFAERQVGIGSLAGTLKRFAEQGDRGRITWVDVTYAKEADSADGLFWLPGAARGTVRGFLQSRRGLRRGPYDALLFLTHNPAVLHPLALRRTPTCLWTDVTPAQLDRMAEAYEHPISVAPMRWAKRAAVSRTFRLAARCLAWSNWARRSFVEEYGISEEQTAVVAPGVDLGRWTFVTRAPPPAAAPFRLLFVGGDFARKGGPLFLDVFRSRLGGRCELAVVTREQMPDEPGVRYYRGLEPSSELLRQLYREADAFVLPTLADCHSLVSLEAMASGLPVITTLVGANAEIVEHGASGLLVPAGDGGSLADAIDALANDRVRARAMGVRGRQIVEKEFDASKTMDLLLGHLRAVAESSTKNGASRSASQWPPSADSDRDNRKTRSAIEHPDRDRLPPSDEAPGA